MNAFRKAFSHLVKDAAPAAPADAGGDSGAYPANLAPNRVIPPVVFASRGKRKKIREKKLLVKSPMATEEASPGLLEGWTNAQRGKPIKPFEGEVHTKTTALPNGMFHHVYNTENSEGGIGMGAGTRHILSNHQDPHQPGLAHMYVNRNHEGADEVYGVFVDSANKGKGLGRAMYDAAIAHHGALQSGHQVSAEANRVWQSIAKDPKYKTNLAPYPEKDLSYYDASRHTTKLAASEKALFGHLRKSPYGPAGMGLYSDADNMRRKMNRSSITANKPTASKQAAQMAAEAKAKSKKNPVKVWSRAEINKHFRNHLRPKVSIK